MRPLCDTRCYVRCTVPATRWRPALCTAAVGDERRRRTPPRAADVDGCLTPVTLSRPPLTSRRRRPGHDAGADVPRVQQAPGVWGGPGGRRRGHEGRRGWGGWERGVRDAQDPERSTGAEDGRSSGEGGAAQTTRGDKLVIITTHRAVACRGQGPGAVAATTPSPYYPARARLSPSNRGLVASLDATADALGGILPRSHGEAGALGAGTGCPWWASRAVASG